ncbi:MAG: thiamine phosphate synthase [Alistipes ihumii]
MTTTDRLTDAPLLVTLPRVLKSEAETLAALCRAGAGPIHIRKPESSAAEVEGLLRDLCAAGADMDCFTLHYDEPLARRYGLGGVHLRGERIAAGAGKGLRRSCSTHGWDEVERYGPVADYVFLSPLFDSHIQGRISQRRFAGRARAVAAERGASSRWAESARKISHGPAWPVSTEPRRSAPSGSRRATGSMRRLPCSGF